MEGSVILDFVALVKERCGAGPVEQALEQPGLASGGAYKANRGYEERELIALAVALSIDSDLTPNQLLRDLGTRAFEHYAREFGATLDETAGTAALLGGIDRHVADSGALLRPYADLLQVHGMRLNSGQLLLQSLMRPPLLEVATGFFAAAAEYYAEPMTVVSALDPDDAAYAGDNGLQTG